MTQEKQEMKLAYMVMHPSIYAEILDGFEKIVDDWSRWYFRPFMFVFAGWRQSHIDHLRELLTENGR